MGHVGLLFWLKWKLMFRGYRRSGSALIGALLMLLIFAPISIGIAALLAMGFANGRLIADQSAALLAGVLLGIYLFWLLAPIVGYSINDTYDITKLFVYPLTLRQIFTGAVLGSLLDIPTLLLLPTLIVAIVTFGDAPLRFVVTFLAIGMFLFQTLALSQGILLLSAGVLKSRRYRDLSIILFSIFGMLYYVLSRTLTSNMVGQINWDGIIRSPVWQALNLLPPGIAAHAASAARLDDYTQAFVWLLALAAYTVGVIYLASWLLQKVYAGQEVGFKPKRGVASSEAAAIAAAPVPASETLAASNTLPAESRDEAPAGALARLWDRLPPVVQAVADKEIRYMFRDPYFKVMLSSIAYVLFVMGFSLYSSAHGTLGRSGVPFGFVGLWTTTGILPLVEMGLICNEFGNDGAAAAVLFMYPCPRRQILIGKNLTLFLALSIVNIVAVVVLSVLAHLLSRIGLILLWLELSLIAMLATGNLLSIYFPYRIVMRGWRVRYGSGSSGFGYFLLYFGMMILVFIILIPVLLALILPMIFNAYGWFLLSLPLAVAYAAGLYVLSLKFAAPLLLQREPEMLAKLSASE